MNRKFIRGAKYFITDFVLEDILEIQILKINDVELSFKDLKTNKEYYRELNQVKVISVIDEAEVQRLNNQNVFSVQDELIRAIISRAEVEKYFKNNFNDLNFDDKTVLISITDPDREFLPENILNMFNDTLSIQFWDIEEAICQYKPINKEKAIIIKEFILKNKDKNFIIHCEAGISRSAGVGLAVYCLINFKGDKYKFSISKNPIKEHFRYHPNLKVFDMIVD